MGLSLEILLKFHIRLLRTVGNTWRRNSSSIVNGSSIHNVITGTLIYNLMLILHNEVAYTSEHKVTASHEKSVLF